MKISEKQIMQLITIVHAHIANMHLTGNHKAVDQFQDLLAEINDQQSEEIKDIE